MCAGEGGSAWNKLAEASEALCHAFAVQVVNRLPSVFGYSLANLQGTVAFLQGLGVDVPKVVGRAPGVFGFRLQSMAATVAYLQGLGLDVPRLVNALPAIFSLSLQGNIVPKVAFLEEEMARPVAEIDRFPAFLSYSLEKRIRPRYKYLQHCNRNTGCTINTMLTPADPQFAERVAGSSLKEYTRWRARGS